MPVPKSLGTVFFLPDLITQVLFFLGFSIALVFWGGAGLLVTSVIAVCVLTSALLLVLAPPGLPVRLWFILVALVLWGFVCLLCAANGMFGHKIFTIQIIYLVSFLVGVKGGKTTNSNQRFLGLLCALCWAEVAYGYYRFLGGSQDVLGLPQPSEYLGRMSGTFVSPNHFADLAGITSILLAGFAMSPQRKVLRILLWIASVLAFSGVILSGSRIVSVACALVLGMMILGPSGSLSRRARIFGLLLGVVILAGSFFFQMGSMHRLIRGFRDPAITARTLVWSDTVSMCLRHHWVGYGLGNYQWFYPQFKSVGITKKVDFAHSDVLQTWAEQGVIGISLWAVFLMACVMGTPNPDRADPLRLALEGAIAVLGAVAIVDFPFQTPAVGMLFFALLGSLAARQEFTAEPRPIKVISVLKVVVASALILLSVGIVRTVVGQIVLIEAQHARRMLFWDEALKKFQRSVWWNPENSVAWKWMGELSRNKYLFSRKTNQVALRQGEMFLARSLQINQRDGSVWVDIGLILMDGGEPVKAMDCFKRALWLDPRNSFFHDMMAKCLIAQQRFMEAKVHLAMASWLYPRDEVAKVLLKKIDRRTGNAKR